jgi:hypothetical protein
LLFFQAGLFQDAVPSAAGKVMSKVSSYRNHSRAFAMFVLAVTSSHPHHHPAVPLKKLDGIANLRQA